jgi:hypothetical protein
MTSQALGQAPPTCPTGCDVNKLAKVSTAGEATATDIAGAGG